MNQPKKILHLDNNHPLLLQQLSDLGFANDSDYISSKLDIEKIIKNYQGVVIRSRFKIDQQFIDAATNLEFIARVGAGLESIDYEYAAKKNITLIAAPEGNANAVGEHAVGMLLSLFNNLNNANNEIKQGIWSRENNRGHEISGKTIGIIGYGNMGQSFAKKLQGFDCQVVFYDIKNNLSDSNAVQVSLAKLHQTADVVSLHLPWTPQTDQIVDHDFINQFDKPFWFINTSRGKNVVTADLVAALQSGKILGAGLDVLEYEKSSFETINDHVVPEPLRYLQQAKNVLLSPHVAGWTYESHQKLSQVIVDKIKIKYFAK